MPEQDRFIFGEARQTAYMLCRIRARAPHKIIYDCLHAKLHPKDHTRVVCTRAHKLKGPGRKAGPGVSLMSVLAGASSRTCQTCTVRDEETDE